MSRAADENFNHLPRAAGWLGAGLARPKLIAVACILILTALGWAYLALMVAEMGASPGRLDTASQSLGLWPRAISALCQPTFGLAGGVLAASGFAVVAMMWAAMVLAMMLPSAAPMIMTYAQIAETAARKGEQIVSPLVIAAGYAVVWLGFAGLAAVMQAGLSRAALLDSDMASVSGLFSGAIFIAAGLYQFSALKQACLRQCRQPFPFFFAHWQTSARGVFRLGLQQGLFCLGCCWAMMLVMFAVGAMNVAWMAVLGVVMTTEKVTSGNRLTSVVGTALIAIGVAFVIAAIAAHRPPHLS